MLETFRFALVTFSCLTIRNDPVSNHSRCSLPILQWIRAPLFERGQDTEEITIPFTCFSSTWDTSA